MAIRKWNRGSNHGKLEDGRKKRGKSKMGILRSCAENKVEKESPRAGGREWM